MDFYLRWTRTDGRSEGGSNFQRGFGIFHLREEGSDKRRKWEKGREEKVSSHLLLLLLFPVQL